MKHNMQILQELAKANGPLCVGLDTDPSYIPENIIKNYGSVTEAVLAFNRAIIHRLSDRVKPLARQSDVRMLT